MALKGWKRGGTKHFFISINHWSRDGQLNKKTDIKTVYFYSSAAEAGLGRARQSQGYKKLSLSCSSASIYCFLSADNEEKSQEKWDSESGVERARARCWLSHIAWSTFTFSRALESFVWVRKIKAIVMPSKVRERERVLPCHQSEPLPRTIVVMRDYIFWFSDLSSQSWVMSSQIKTFLLLWLEPGLTSDQVWWPESRDPGSGLPGGNCDKSFVTWQDNF